MVQKYIIDKSDLPDLIQGKELALEQGNKFRAFCIEINGKMTNGDVIKTVFSDGQYGTNGNYVHVFGVGGNGVWTFTKDWWNALYNAGNTDGNRKSISAKLPDQIDKQYREDVFFNRREK